MRKKYEIHEIDDKGRPRYFVMQTNSKRSYGECAGYSYDRPEARMILGLARGAERRRHAKLAKRQAKQREENSARRAELRSEIDMDSILYTSWGYDQTNVEFYQVVGTYGKFGVELRRIGAQTIKATGPDSSRIRPAKGLFIEPKIRKTVGSHGVRIGSSQTAWPAGERESFHCSWGH